MRVVAVASVNPQEARAIGLGLGLLARADLRVEHVQPEETLVDRLVLQDPPDLLLLDADMARFQPFLAIKALRRFSAFMLLPIFVVSEVDRAEDARTAGATRFFRKPVQEKDLEDALARYVKPVLRKAPRKGLRGPCVVSKGGLKYEGRISDVSILGAQVVVSDRIPVGTMIQLGFALIMQKTPHVIRVNARVVREVPGGYGLAFSALDQQARGLIAAFAKA